MSRQTWSKGDLKITYGNPYVTPFTEKIISDMKQVMYFYYDIDVVDGNKTIFSARTHDFPKVQNLPAYIDHVLDMKEEDMYVYEDLKKNGFERKKLYAFIDLGDSFDMEYHYKIERQVMYVKQRNEDVPKRYEEFKLSIGEHERGKDYSKSIFIDYLEREDIIRLK